MPWLKNNSLLADAQRLHDTRKPTPARLFSVTTGNARERSFASDLRLVMLPGSRQSADAEQIEHLLSGASSPTSAAGIFAMFGAHCPNA
jgi:hypothetical protein